jgi:hypothetical protein
MRHDHDSFRDQIRADHKKRCEFLLTVLKEEEPLEAHEGFSFLSVCFLQSEDLEWLLSISPRGAVPIAGINEQSLCALIQVVCNLGEPSHFEALYEIAMRWEPLHQRYQELLDGIPLDSPAANRMREYHQFMVEMEGNRPPLVDPPPEERVRIGLERFEAGDIDAWWRLNLSLTLSPRSTHYNELQSRITKMPGWSAAGDETRRRILNAAKKYLENGQPRVEKWLGKNSYQHSDLSAYRALVLLREVDRETYEGLDADVWKKWAPVVVGVPKETGTVEGKFHDDIAAEVSAKAPREFARTVQRLIRAERRRNRAQPQTPPAGPIPFFVLRTLDECWSSKALKEVVHAELKNRNNSPAECEALLEPLLTADFEPAHDFARHLLTGRHRSTGSRWPFVLVAATQLLAHSPVQSWSAVWERVSADQVFGHELFERLAHNYRHEQAFYSAFDEAQLAELYLWLAQAFPHRTDPHGRVGRPFWAGPRDSVAQLRDGVLTYLVNRGTEKGVAVIRRVVTQLSDLTWLVYQLLEAEQIMRTKTWAPLSPVEIVRVTESPRGLLVQSAQQLADVLVDALRNYERELHGEQTPVRGLWDRQGGGPAFRPVDENALSDDVRHFLSRNLVENGIILNREVEISRVPGAPVGKRTDIKVDAVRRTESSEKFGTITAVIETKGCWNPELLKAIKTQLVDDYLVRLAAPVGIYMVGWFDKAKWDATDSRKAGTPDWSIEEVLRRLNEEVAALPQAFILRAVVLDCHAP